MKLASQLNLLSSYIPLLIASFFASICAFLKSPLLIVQKHTTNKSLKKTKQVPKMTTAKMKLLALLAVQITLSFVNTTSPHIIRPLCKVSVARV